MKLIKIIAVHSSILLLLAACSESMGKKVADKIMPLPPKPSPEVVDQYRQEADLLEKELNGIRFLSDIGEQKDKEIFLKSSQTLRERMSADAQLKSRLRSKMPAEIWLRANEPNYDFTNFNPDVTQPFINIGHFGTADEIIDFLESFPDRSLPEISKRIAQQDALNKAAYAKGKYKLNIYIGGNSLSKGVAELGKVEGALSALSEAELGRISDITIGLVNRVDASGNKVSFHLNESSSSSWLDFIRSNLN